MKSLRFILLVLDEGRTHFSTSEMLKYLLSLQHGSLVRKCVSEWMAHPLQEGTVFKVCREGPSRGKRPVRCQMSHPIGTETASFGLPFCDLWFDPILVILRRLSGS